MKKILILFAFIISAIYVNAQVDLKSEYSLTTDTVTNTGTVYMTVGAAFSGDNILAVSAKTTQLSGTSAGTATLEWSIDGTDYKTHPTADTMTIANGAVYIWSLDHTYAKKYRVKFTGSGTNTTKVEGKYIYK